MINIPLRKIGLTAALLPVLLLIASCDSQSSRLSGKKGVGDYLPGASARVNGLKVSWYYNWGTEPSAGETEAEFVPMIWSGFFATDKALASIKANPKYTHLLGFNEPDFAEQSAMSVEKAIELWPKLMATGKRLGSPAVTQSEAGARWLEEFMSKAKARGYRVDFLCVHWYDDVTDPQGPAMMASYLLDLHDKYRLPIWLTEFSGGDWKFLKNKPLTYKHNTDFIPKALPLLEELPFVERYAWFAAICDLKPHKIFYEKASLYKSVSGEMTAVGAAYRDFKPEPRAGAGPFRRVPYPVRHPTK
ncbi:MAG: glycoside hydrolase family protein [Elusimicrobiota bacterium]